MAAIGIDVGGGGVRGAVVRDGTLGEVRRIDLDEREVANVVAAVASVVLGLGGAEAVGVGVPGFVERGVVRASPNFTAWRDVPLARMLRAELGVPVVVANDANAATWGAYVARGRGEDLVVLTLGTGVGGGVVSDGRLLLGARGTAGELGHIPVGGTRSCGCGGEGCLEQHLGTVGLVAAAAEHGRTVGTGQAVVEAARAGEPWARTVMDDAGAALGRGLVALVNVFNPDTVLLLGGLAGARDLLAPTAEAWLASKAVGPSAAHVRVEWGDRADGLAIAGAAALATEAT